MIQKNHEFSEVPFQCIFNDFGFLLDISMTTNLHVWFYCLPYNTLYHLRDWSHGVERFAFSECILFHVAGDRVGVQSFEDLDLKDLNPFYKGFERT